ncbi:LOW QUALITY PROTEIN: thioredoxin domain-containing protein 3 [Podargus strigoides]
MGVKGPLEPEQHGGLGQVIDVAWCVHCKAVVNLFKKSKTEFGEDDVLHFAVVRIDGDKLYSTPSPPLRAVKYSVGIIKPDDVLEGRVEEIKQKIRDAGFGIEAAEEKMLTEEQISVFHAWNEEQVKNYAFQPNFENFVQFMSGPCHVLVISKKEATDAIPFWKELPESSESMPDEPEAEKPGRLEGNMETESILNVSHVQDSVEDASRQLAFFSPNFDINKTDQKVEKTLALIRPCLLKERQNSILQSIKDDGFKIAMQREIILSEEQICFYQEHENEGYFPVLEQMTSGPTLVLALTENAIEHWRCLLGTKTVEEAMKENPDSIQLTTYLLVSCNGSSTPGDAQKEFEFFPQEHTLALIKPDAAKKHRDDIMQKVKDAGFAISNIKEAALTHEMATQFYEHHKGKPFLEQLVTCMTKGPSVIMVLTKENAVEDWRQLMGPTDPKVAETSPESIRAQFAQDVLSNAIHGSSDREHALKSIECLLGGIDID